MGLDMRVYKVKQNLMINNGTGMRVNLEDIHDDDDDDDDDDVDVKIFYYWIKHPDLHAWFLNLYEAKLKEQNKKDKIKHNQSRWVVEVTLKDIEMLKQLVILNQLPKWQNSWLGNTNLKDTANTIKFTLKAEEFWISQLNKHNNNHDDDTLVYCGYW